jgi:rsbT antagonist protein RsbS
MARVPILHFGNALLVSIQIDLQDDTVLALQEDLAERDCVHGSNWSCN